MMTLNLITALPKALTPKDLKKAEVVLSRALKLSHIVVSVSFVSPAKIQELNKAYRKKNKPTDVLSFASDTSFLPKGERELGDIFICSTYAQKEAKRRALSLHEELMRLLVHGVLHLKGYDHATEDDEARMFELQERLLERIIEV